VNNLRRQGLTFSALALALVTASLLLPRLEPAAELLIFAALVLVLGVPHGALDPIFARRLFAVRGLAAWAVFVGAYVGLALLVIAFWLLTPAAFLILFLVASTLHFSGDPAPGTPWLTRLLYGGAVIVLPVLNHAPEMTQLFGFFVDANAAYRFVSTLRFLAWPWAVGLGWSVLVMCRRDWVTAVELASYSLLVLVAPPLLSFTVFFCLMHSARHALRTQRYASLSWRQLLLTSAAPTAAVVAAALATWSFVKDAPLDMRLVQCVVIGLAALTAPHMLLVERIRFSGWAKPA
jgi:Brp/Blh family beta-carotene 15,15'-monooxygenase